MGGQRLEGTLVAPNRLVPGVMLVHGWDGNQEQYLARAHEIAALGCVCLTFDLRGHGKYKDMRDTVTREDNLQDMLSAFDLLVGHPAVDGSAIAVVGSSYGGYLASILTSMRQVRWLALRVPAMYRDEDWNTAKRALSKEDLNAYRQTIIPVDANRALKASSEFRGDVLLVESEHDVTVPHPVIVNYLSAFKHAHSMTYRVIRDADHSLSKKEWRQTYSSMLVKWMTEMIAGAHEEQNAAISKEIALEQANAKDEAAVSKRRWSLTRHLRKLKNR